MSSKGFGHKLNYALGSCGHASLT